MITPEQISSLAQTTGLRLHQQEKNYVQTGASVPVLGISRALGVQSGNRAHVRLRAAKALGRFGFHWLPVPGRQEVGGTGRHRPQESWQDIHSETRVGSMDGGATLQKSDPSVPPNPIQNS